MFPPPPPPSYDKYNACLASSSFISNCSPCINHAQLICQLSTLVSPRPQYSRDTRADVDTTESKTVHRKENMGVTIRR